MLTTTAQLLTMLQEEVGDVQPSSSTSTRLLNLLDRAHVAIVAGGGELNLDETSRAVPRPFIFPWATEADPKVVNLEPAQTGAANVTKASASVTIDINSSTKDLTGWDIRIGQDNITYNISAHSGTTVTLNSVYQGTTDASDTFTAFKLEYDYGSDILIPAGFIRLYSEEQGEKAIDIVDLREFYKQTTKGKAEQGQPTLAGIVKETEGTITLRFDKYPEANTRTELEYVAEPSTLDTSSVNPIIPSRHRTVIVHLAAYYHLRKRDDDRASSHFKSALSIFETLKTEANHLTGRFDRDYAAVNPWPGGWPGNTYKKGRLS